MNLAKLDKFYIALFVILALMAALVIFTFRTIFSSYNMASDLSQRDATTGLMIDKQELDSASSWVENKETVPLEIR